VNFFKQYTKDLSLISLLFSNVFIIILAIVENWNASTVLWIYWMQSVTIGFFNFFRILSLKNFSTEGFKIDNQHVLPTTRTKIHSAFFFFFHYGFFHFIYAIFLFNLFKLTQEINIFYLFSGGLVFFINHLFSFLYNKAKDSQQKQNIGKIMLTPYLRIIPMHVIIIFGAILGQASLIVFLLIKTFVDLIFHNRKHSNRKYN
jgi:hypothetical protein